MALEVSDTQIVYQRSMGSRVFCGVSTPFIAALFVSLPIMIAPSSSWFQARSPLDIVSFLALPFVMCLFGLVIALSGLYGAGPEDVVIDLTTRAYRFRRGFPLLARWQMGTLDDVEAICVRTYQNKSATFYKVMLAWKGQGRQTWFPIGDGRVERRKDVFLSGHKSTEEANAQAQKLAAGMGVPAEPAGSERYGQNPEQTLKRSNPLIAIAAAIGSLFLFLISGLPLLVQYQLDVQGRTTSGTVVKRWYGKYAHITAAYQVGGRTFKSSDDVKYTDYENLALQTPVTVTYLPAYPKTSRTNISNARRFPVVMLSVYGGFLLLGCFRHFFGKRKRV